MVQKNKSASMKCDCSTLLEARQTLFEGFHAKAMVCPNCGFTTLTKEQAEKYVQLRHNLR